MDEPSPSNGEILTISLGPYAAAVATHYWNATSDHDAKQDVLFHQPSSKLGVAKPRAVVLDWAGGSKVRKQWKMKPPPTTATTTTTATTSDDEETPEAEPHIFDTFFETPSAQTPTAVEETTESTPAETDTVHWWKFITPTLNDRTVNLISEQTAREWGHTSYGQGTEMWKQNRGFFEDTFSDNIRYFFEAMDKPQGVNLMTDGNGLFSGIAGELLAEMKDTYGRTSVFTTALFDHNVDEADDDHEKVKNKKKHFTSNTTQEVDFEALNRWEQQGVNRCLNHAILSEHSSGYLPIDVNSWCKIGGRTPGWFTQDRLGLKLDVTNTIDTSAFIATSLSTVFAPLQESEISLPHFCDTLRPLPSMRVSSLYTSLPFPAAFGERGVNMKDLVEKASFDAFVGLSHGWPMDETEKQRLLAREPVAVLSQIFSLRGLHSVPKAEGGVPHTQFCNEYWSEVFKTPRTFSCLPQTPQLLSGTFPLEILPGKLNVVGWQDPAAPEEYTTENTIPTQIPVGTMLSTTCASALMLHGLMDRLKATEKRRHTDQHLEHDQWFELQEQMSAVCFVLHETKKVFHFFLFIT